MKGVRGRLAAMRQSTKGAGAQRVVQMRTTTGRTGRLAHRWKQHDFADRAAPCKEHDEAVDADPDAARRRHPVLQRVQEALVERLRLLVALLGVADLLLEA